MEFKKFLPANALKPYVFVYSILNFYPTLKGRPKNLFPSGAISVNFDIGGQITVSTPKLMNKVLPRAYVLGQMTGRQTYFSDKLTKHVSIVFHNTGFFKLTKVSPKIATNIVVPTLELGKSWDELGYKLQDCHSDLEIVNQIDKFLLFKLSKAKINSNRVENMIKWFYHTHKGKRIKDASKFFKVTERTLSKDFNEWMGMSPKRYFDILRFHKAIFILKQKQPIKLTDLAYNLDYSDQAHFTKSFRRLSGFTPKDYLTMDLEFRDDMILEV